MWTSGSGARGSSRASPRAGRGRAATGTRTAPGTITPSAAVSALIVRRPERRRRVDEDVVVVGEHRHERLLERALAADHRRQRELGAGEVDRGRPRCRPRDGLDHVLHRQLVHEHVEHRAARAARGRCPGSSSGSTAGRGRSTSTRLPRSRSAAPRLTRRRRLRDAALLVREREHARTVAAAVDQAEATRRAETSEVVRAGMLTRHRLSRRHVLLLPCAAMRSPEAAGASRGRARRAAARARRGCAPMSRSRARANASRVGEPARVRVGGALPPARVPLDASAERRPRRAPRQSANAGSAAGSPAPPCTSAAGRRAGWRPRRATRRVERGARARPRQRSACAWWPSSCASTARVSRAGRHRSRRRPPRRRGRRGCRRARIRRVGPMPTTAALPALVLSPRRSRRTSRTTRPLERDEVVDVLPQRAALQGLAAQEERQQHDRQDHRQRAGRRPRARPGRNRPAVRETALHLDEERRGRQHDRRAEREALQVVDACAAQALAREARGDRGAVTGDPERQAHDLERDPAERCEQRPVERRRQPGPCEVPGGQRERDEHDEVDRERRSPAASRRAAIGTRLRLTEVDRRLVEHAGCVGHGHRAGYQGSPGMALRSDW